MLASPEFLRLTASVFGVKCAVRVIVCRVSNALEVLSAQTDELTDEFSTGQAYCVAE